MCAGEASCNLPTLECPACNERFMEKHTKPGLTGTHGMRIVLPRETRGAIVGTWLASSAAALFAALFLSLAMTNRASHVEGLLWLLFGTVTSVAAAMLFAYGLWLTAGRSRYGETRLALDDVAFGSGRMRGWLEVPRASAPHRVRLSMSCRAVAQHARRGAPDSVHGGRPAAWKALAKTLSPDWQIHRQAARHTEAGRCRYAFDIELPDADGQTAAAQSWTLKASAEVEGVDLSRNFDLSLRTLAARTAKTDTPRPTPSADAMATVARAELGKGVAPHAIAERFGALGIAPGAIRKALDTAASKATEEQAQAVRDWHEAEGRTSAASAEGEENFIRAPSTRQRRARIGHSRQRRAVLLASERTLHGGRAAGCFLLVWGALFGGIPLVILFAGSESAEPALWLFVLLGLGAFTLGLYLLGKRKRLWYNPARDRIEEHAGFLNTTHVANHVLEDFNTVAIDTRVSIGNKGQRHTYFEVAAHGPKGRNLHLGRFSRLTRAVEAAVEAAVALELPLVDRATREDALEFSPTDLSLLVTATEHARPPSRRPAILALVAANLVPLGGVLWFDWAVFPLMLVFWLENLVIGAYNALRMLAAARSSLGERLTLTAFFAVHYGGFCAGHGIFLVALFGGDRFEGGPHLSDFGETINANGLWIAVLALAASHGFSFARNYLGEREYKHVGVQQLMMAPYSRIVVLHVLLIAGAWVVTTLQAPALILAALVVGKIVIDVKAHDRQHRAFALRAYDELVESRAEPAPSPGSNRRVWQRLASGAAGIILVGGFLAFNGILPAIERLFSQPAIESSATPGGKPRAAPGRTPVVADPDRAATDASPNADASTAVNAPWRDLQADAQRAANKKKFNEARRLYQAAIDGLRAELGSDHPGLATLLVERAGVFDRQQRAQAYESDMLEAWRIVAGLGVASIRAALAGTSLEADKEAIARELGDHFWDQRDYVRAFEYYELAYQAADALDTTPEDYNRRQASNSAGRMATACMLGRWEIADEAMAELKKRIRHVDAQTRERLEYWIRTGEPRLANRKC